MGLWLLLSSWCLTGCDRSVTIHSNSSVSTISATHFFMIVQFLVQWVIDWWKVQSHHLFQLFGFCHFNHSFLHGSTVLSLVHHWPVESTIGTFYSGLMPSSMSSSSLWMPKLLCINLRLWSDRLSSFLPCRLVSVLLLVYPPLFCLSFSPGRNLLELGVYLRCWRIHLLNPWTS